MLLLKKRLLLFLKFEVLRVATSYKYCRLSDCRRYDTCKYGSTVCFLYYVRLCGCVGFSFRKQNPSPGCCVPAVSDFADPGTRDPGPPPQHSRAEQQRAETAAQQQQQQHSTAEQHSRAETAEQQNLLEDRDLGTNLFLQQFAVRISSSLHKKSGECNQSLKIRWCFEFRRIYDWKRAFSLPFYVTTVFHFCCFPAGT